MIIEGLSDEEWNEHVMMGEAYTAMTLVGAVGGTSPQLQMFNPVASGRRIRLRCLEPIAFASGRINTNIRRHDVALVNPGGLFGAGSPQNLLGSGGPPVAEFRFDNVAALVGSPFWLILAAGPTRRDYPARHLEWGHDLIESQGMMMSGTFGGFLIIGWQWVEVPL